MPHVTDNRASDEPLTDTEPQLDATSNNPGDATLISVSVVIYRPVRDLLKRTSQTLDAALHCLTDGDKASIAPLFVENDVSGKSFNEADAYKHPHFGANRWERAYHEAIADPRQE